MKRQYGRRNYKNKVLNHLKSLLLLSFVFPFHHSVMWWVLGGGVQRGPLGEASHWTAPVSEVHTSLFTRTRGTRHSRSERELSSVRGHWRRLAAPCGWGWARGRGFPFPPPRPSTRGLPGRPRPCWIPGRRWPHEAGPVEDMRQEMRWNMCESSTEFRFCSPHQHHVINCSTWFIHDDRVTLPYNPWSVSR